MFASGSQLERLQALVGDFAAGSVSLVGAGPGGAALVTLRGAVRLSQADVVLHDKLVAPELLELAPPAAERIFVGKWRGRHVWTQQEINAELVRQARLGRRVVRLKGGDPFVFGRGGEECLHLAETGVPFEVVPGITAAFGAPATAGIPLTHRGLSRSFALVTGHAEPDDPDPVDFASLARMETLAFYMGMKNLAENCRRLIEAGLDPRTPAAVIHQGTGPRQETLVGTVGDIADRVASTRLASPAMILVGEVVRLRESIQWFERRPLHGATVVVTRARDQAAGLSGPLRAAGAEVIEAPTIQIGEPEDDGPVRAALGALGGPGPGYDWVAFTSTNGVEAFFAALERSGRDARVLGGVKVAAVGAATAERLLHSGIRADLVPVEATGAALSAAMLAGGGDNANRRVLLPRADIARPELPAALRQAGWICDDVAFYRTTCAAALPAALLDRLDAGSIHWITLTSPSCFENLLSLLGEARRGLLASVRLASIGPTTTLAIRAAGFREAVEAERHDVPGLVAALVRAAAQSHLKP